MPNHFHGIIIIENRRGLIHQTYIKEYISDNKGLMNQAPTKFNNENANIRKYLIQPYYYDNIIRDEEELNRNREYVINNPLKWEIDEYYKLYYWIWINYN